MNTRATCLSFKLASRWERGGGGLKWHWTWIFFCEWAEREGEATSHLCWSLYLQQTLRIKSSLKMTQRVRQVKDLPIWLPVGFSNSQKMWILSVKVRQKWVGAGLDSRRTHQAAFALNMELMNGNWRIDSRHGRLAGYTMRYVSLLLLCCLCLMTCWTACVRRVCGLLNGVACIWVVFMCMQLKTTSTKKKS